MPARDYRSYAAQAADELRSLCRAHGITNRELAEACGRNEFWVGKRINGQVPMDLDDLELVARALGVEPGELLPKNWEAPPSPDPGTDGDAGWAPRGSNPQPADYKFASSPRFGTDSDDLADVRPLLPRRRLTIVRPPRPRRLTVVPGELESAAA
jgi:transcriptional regulator with XRE-family HTH domain